MEQLLAEVVQVLQPILQSKYAPWLLLGAIVIIIVISASRVGFNVHKLIAYELAETLEEHGVTEAELQNDEWADKVTTKVVDHALTALEDPVVKLRFKSLYRRILASKKAYNTIKNFVKKEAFKFFKLVNSHK